MLATLPAEEEHILRCLGASAIVNWDNLPKTLQRKFFDSRKLHGRLIDDQGA
jgi:hypothetical protein